MNKTRTLIVEDDISSMNLLKLTIEENFPNIELIGFANTLRDAIDIINSEKPDLVFLDIELPDGYGYDILNFVDYINFEIIFVTSFNKYAVKAFELSALHYLLKPINKETLSTAIERYRHKASFKEMKKKLEVLNDNFKKNSSKIMLPTGNGMEIFDYNEIMRCEADDNYTILYFQNKKYVLISKNLTMLEKVLEDCGFYRVHRKYLINLNYIKKFYKNRKNPSLVMVDGAEIPISENRFEGFIEMIESSIKMI